MPIHHIEHCADIIVNIILKETTNLKFMTSIVKQAYIFLRATVSRKSFKGKETVFNTSANNHSSRREIAHPRRKTHASSSEI